MRADRVSKGPVTRVHDALLLVAGTVGAVTVVAVAALPALGLVVTGGTVLG